MAPGRGRAGGEHRLEALRRRGIRDLARLYLQLGREREAISLLLSAIQLFRRLGAGRDADAAAVMVRELGSAG
jgi:hypothetical protein